MVVIGAFTPGIQGFVGYAAGFAQMNYTRFVIAVFFGKLVWVSALLYLGWILGNHLALIDRIIQQFGLAVLVVFVVAGVWYVRRHRRLLADQVNTAKRSND
jgi:membrane protein DedA with SNARE-associated domain